MRQQGPYGGSNINPLVAVQMQHIAAQRMQHNLDLNLFPGRSDVPPLDEERCYTSSTVEDHWQHGKCSTEFNFLISLLKHALRNALTAVLLSTGRPEKWGCPQEIYVGANKIDVGRDWKMFVEERHAQSEKLGRRGNRMQRIFWFEPEYV
eukprot:Gb_24458 [translate_table: standard]